MVRDDLPWDTLWLGSGWVSRCFLYIMGADWAAWTNYNRPDWTAELMMTNDPLKL